MSEPLAGRTVALAEGRQLEELARMLEKEGATALRCPMVSILDAPDPAPVTVWLRELIADRFEFVVLFTGEGVRRLLGFAERQGLREQLIDALRRTRTIVRGPKPVQALKEIGLAPTRIASAPTTAGVIAALREESLRGRTVGVQLYAETNAPLLEYLEETGASVSTVLPYIYAPAADGDRVADLISQMKRGKISVIVFTSSPQVDRLYTVASERGLEGDLGNGLAQTCVAAVGPVVADNLRRRGSRVDVCPEQGFVMRNLVQQLRRHLDS